MNAISSRRIAVLTTGRQDWGALRSVVLLLSRDPRFAVRLLVGGMHLKSRFGRTVDLVRQDGVPVAAELDFIAEPPEPEIDAARAVEMTAQALRRERPDALLLLGDRHETLAAALAATVLAVPIAHLHGGEESEGAIDGPIRHAVTKLSHLHLVSHELHARRVLQMGEAPANVVVVGAPGLDNLYREDLLTRTELEAALGNRLADPLVLVTVQPTTLASDPLSEVTAVASAMARVPATYVITQPNADRGGAGIREWWLSWGPGRSGVVLADALGEARYWGLLRLASAVLGNSSSGIIEAPEAGVPAVNVGDRQKGRLRGRGVVNVAVNADAIAEALQCALEPGARERVRALPATYPRGPAAPRVVSALAEWHMTTPPRKRFREVAWTPSA
jgi:UDP-hydrolysing UDP-N-acetyl-D-glucosamine 2-epimerase